MGDVVLAIGNPFGIGQTVTMGIVSATRRGGMGIEDYEDFIQTDAGLKSGDVVMEFNGKPVEDSRSLRLMVGQTVPGAKVSLMVLRDGKEQSFSIALKEMPALFAAHFSAWPPRRDAAGGQVRFPTELSVP